MSKVAIKGATTGTGTFTIESPATNTDRTLVLPDNAGTVLTSASDLAAANLTGNVAAARITDALNASGSAPIYACRAWVNFDGDTGSGNTILGSGNVSSVSRTATGEYTVNFSTAMPDVNYATNISTRWTGSGSTVTGSVRGTGFSTNSVDIVTWNSSFSATNSPQVNISIFR